MAEPRRRTKTATPRRRVNPEPTTSPPDDDPPAPTSRAAHKPADTGGTAAPASSAARGSDAVPRGDAVPTRKPPGDSVNDGFIDRQGLVVDEAPSVTKYSPVFMSPSAPPAPPRGQNLPRRGPLPVQFSGDGYGTLPVQMRG